MMLPEKSKTKIVAINSFFVNREDFNRMKHLLKDAVRLAQYLKSFGNLWKEMSERHKQNPNESLILAELSGRKDLLASTPSASASETTADFKTGRMPHKFRVVEMRGIEPLKTKAPLPSTNYINSLLRFGNNLRPSNHF